MNPTEEQIKARLAAVGTTQEQLNQNAITAGDLTTAPDPKFTQPTPVATDNPKTIPTPDLSLTKPEEDAENLIKDIEKLNLESAGESAFRTQKESEAGITGLAKTSEDLSNQLKALQAQAEATKISPEFEQKNTLSQFAEGERGRALRDIGVRALIVGANLQAAQGNLATALELVDRSVAQKFDPLNAEINAKMKNLQLIMSSPEFSLTDKKRAETTNRRLEAEKTQLENDRANSKKISEMAVTAASKGADAITLKKINDLLKNPTDENVAEAMKLAAPFSPETSTQVIGSAETGYMQFNPKTGRYDIPVSTPGGGRTKLIASSGFFDPKIESSVREDYVSLTDSYKNPVAPTDEEKQNSFNKLRSLYSPQEVSDEALKGLVGIKPLPAGQQTPEEIATSWLDDISLGGTKIQKASGLGSFIGRLFGEEETRLRFNQLDKKFRDGGYSKFTEQEKNEYRELLKLYNN